MISLFPGFRSVRNRMLFWILAVTVPIYAGSLYMSSEANAQRLEAEAERNADELATRLAFSVDAVIRPIEGGIRTVAYLLEEVDPPREGYGERILGILGAWPDVYGSTIAVEPGANSKPFAPYLFRNADGIQIADLATQSYAYRELPWYRSAAESGEPVWSDPYFDVGGGDIWMITYSVPFFRTLATGERVLAGVVTADLALDWVRKTAAEVELGPLGMGWLSSPVATAAFVAPIGATETRVEASGLSIDDATIDRFGRVIGAGASTFDLLPDGHFREPAYVAVRTLDTLKWRLTLLMPARELMADAQLLFRRQLELGAIGLLLLVAAISFVASGIARPVRALASAVGSVGENKLDFALPVTDRRDEVGTLAAALMRMRDSLQEHVRLRAESLAAQARLTHELEIAARIQQSMLPGMGAASLLPRAAEVAALLLPAREVGGDLYDYFAVGDSQILFAVGDVSDKGIPAALFMARLSAMLRVLGLENGTPDRLLAGMNARLAESNDACMFVTVGCGLFDLDSGRIRYASAGHEPPLVRRFEGRVEVLLTENGAAIGIEAVSEYRLHDCCLAPGDTIVLYTDGVTEAENTNGVLFGMERLAALLESAPEGAPATLIKRIADHVAAHSPDFHATDDLTAMAVRFAPLHVQAFLRDAVPCWSMAVEPSGRGLEQALKFLEVTVQAREALPGRLPDLQVIAEELLANIIRLAGAGSSDIRITLELAWSAAEICLTVRDTGPPFDPLQVDASHVDAALEDRPIGGLGIHLVRQLTLRCEHAREGDWNVFDAWIGPVCQS